MFGEVSLAEFRLGLLLPPLFSEPVLVLVGSSLLDAALRGSTKSGWAGLGPDAVAGLWMVLVAAGGWGDGVATARFDWGLKGGGVKVVDGVSTDEKKGMGPSSTCPASGDLAGSGNFFGAAGVVSGSTGGVGGCKRGSSNGTLRDMVTGWLKKEAKKRHCAFFCW